MEIKGNTGEVINRCIDKRIFGQNTNLLADPIKLTNETRCWQTEFWEKWMLSAVGAYQYSKDLELMERMKYAVERLLATQMKDGYARQTA